MLSLIISYKRQHNKIYTANFSTKASRVRIVLMKIVQQSYQIFTITITHHLVIVIATCLGEDERRHICFIFRSINRKKRVITAKVRGVSDTLFTRGSIHEANAFKIHVHDVCSKFALSCKRGIREQAVNCSVAAWSEHARVKRRSLVR